MGETSTNLQIMSVTASHGGSYTCEANITSGTAFGSVTININPEFTSQPNNVSAFNGSMATVTCEASAYPSPVYEWIRVGGQPVRNGVTTNSSVLLLNPVQFGDEGDYYCNASSGGITIQSEAITIAG